MNAQQSDDLERNDRLACAMAAGRRIVIANVSPSVDGGRYPAKRCIGDLLTVEADIFAEGHEQIAADLMVRSPGETNWARLPMKPLGNDRWSAGIPLLQTGRSEYRLDAWLDQFGGHLRDLAKKREAGQAREVDAQEAAQMIAQRMKGAKGAIREALSAILDAYKRHTLEDRLTLLLAAETRQAMQAADNKSFSARSEALTVDVERRRAGFASWYELFPRSCGQRGRHGTFRDVITALPRIRSMGFDVLYMTPIHPIGVTNRKGRNNALKAEPDDIGSPYAIGGKEGGHDALHPELGSMEDFVALVEAARAEGMELALDFATQMSPDHPWLAEHPHWFRRRPDGSIKYAENPPKKYEDIVNPDFYADPELWRALRDVFLFWIGHGVHIFRVDNPHTKPFPFWEWLIADIRGRHPEVIFLAEAFTRPKLMYRLAQIGFNQSYTYFTWRNSKRELTEYLTELAAEPVRDFFRPHFFVNTPDINPFFLQSGGRPAFLIRAALAATLSGLWGLYSGFEICEAASLPGREEYRDSEKYELRQRDYSAAGNIVAEITQLNALRAAEPALQSHMGLTFYNAFNDNVLYYGKTDPNNPKLQERLLIAVSLDPHGVQECDFEVPLWEWGLSDHASVAVEDLLRGYKFIWSGKVQHLALSPQKPYAIWRIRPHGSGP